MPFDARLTLVDTPTLVRAGGEAVAVVDVTNTGQVAWEAGGPIRLAYHVRDARGGLVLFDGARTLLPSDVEPGATLRLCARLRAPDLEGAHLVEWDLVHEGVTWLSQLDGRATVTHRVTLVSPTPPWARRWPVAAWLFITLAHTALSWVWAIRWRRARPSASVDETFFVGTVAWLGTMSIVLHVAAATAGLSLMTAGAGVAVAQALLHLGVGDRLPTTAPEPRSSGQRWLDWAGMTVLIVIVTQWIAGDVLDPSISGTDAAHYHVPHAINFALGGNLFDIGATPHLYPVGTSVLAAWLILPVQSGLLVDSATLPSFILLVAALGWLFRQMTGSSGLSVVPWFMVAVLTMPIVRVSAPVSADLPFAASFIALLGNGLAVVSGRASGPTLLLTGVLAGVLAGSKTQGAPAAVILLGLQAAGLVLQRRRASWTRPSRWTLLAATTAIALAVAAGGVWQVRNWRNYGSPLAPIGVQVLGVTIFPGQPYDAMRNYLSVARDIGEDGGLRVWRTAKRHLASWAGPWLSVVTWLTPLVLVDALLAHVRGVASGLARIRLMFMTAFLVSNGILVWLLVGAPWTSLRWTNGLALRYALPTLVLGTFLAPLAAFPLNVAWSDLARVTATVCLALASMAVALAVDPPPEQDAGRHLLNMTWQSVAVGIVVAAAIVLVSRRRGRGPWLAQVAAVSLCVAALAGGSALAARAADQSLAADARRHLQGPCRGATVDESAPRLAARLIERHDGQRSGGDGRRRVFVAARFDVPLALQGATFDTRVYDARGPNLIDRVLADSGPGAGRSDYIIASIADLATTQGAPLVRRTQARTALVELGDAGPYRVWYVTPLPPAR